MARHVFSTLALFTATLLVAGCSGAGEPIPRSVAAALDAPDEFVLYSLDPDLLGRDEEQRKLAPKPYTGPMFRGLPVVGQTLIKDTETQKKLVAAFRRGVADYDGSVGKSFIPHHGIRVRKGDQTVELVVSFMCSQVRVSENGIGGRELYISTSPRKAFNEVLRAAKVKLCEDFE